jgi:hypothetical protein
MAQKGVEYNCKINVLPPIPAEMVYFNVFDDMNRIMPGSKVIFVLTQKTVTVIFRNNSYYVT